MKYDHPEVMDPALEVIKGIDPVLHGQMMRSRWDVHVITDLYSDPMRMSHPGSPELQFLLDNPAAGMLTDMALPGKPTDVVLPHILRTSKIGRVQVHDAIADYLVHEFVHHHGYDEVPAYVASAEFARKMGSLPLFQNSVLGVVGSVTGQI